MRKGEERLRDLEESKHCEVTLLFFAAARERAGESELLLKLPAGSSLATLKEELFTLKPKLAPLSPYLRWAVNENFVNDINILYLKNGDRVALIPPVSGG